MKYVGITLALLVLAFVIYVATGKSTAIDEELAKLSPGEKQALDALLADSGVAATKLRLVEMRALKFNAKAAVIEQGRLVGLRLSQVPLRHADAVVGRTLARPMAAGEALDPKLLPEELRSAAPGADPDTSETLDAAERRHLMAVLARHPTLDSAAKALGIDPSTLYRKRDRHGLP